MKHTLIFSLAVILLLSSCKKELDRINVNPNETQNPQPGYLLTGATKTAVDVYWGTTNNMSGGLLFTQQLAKLQYTEDDRFIFSNNSFTGLWSSLYAQSIAGCNQIIKIAESTNNPNYKGVALTLRAWCFLLLTDAYGDIPYSQAGQLDKFITPVYDKQSDVYSGLLADLKSAKNLLNTNGSAISGDILYKNNISKWIKFANALRLRIALRIADAAPDKAKQVITDLNNDNDAIFADNTDIAQLIYQLSPQQNPISAAFDTRDDYRISKTIVDKLTDLNDPRLAIYASKTEATTPEVYVGLPNGLTNSGASAIGFTKTSKPGAYFLAPQAPAVIVSFAEVLFDRAEAAARGFTTENAADLYLQAIKASLQQYGIADAAINSYLAQNSVQFDAANYKKSIGEQKWLALFGQGLEAWAEQRRLDYPQLTPSVNTVLNGKIPVRFIYPASEQTLNGQNYTIAVSNQGADALTTKLWFDVN